VSIIVFIGPDRALSDGSEEPRRDGAALEAALRLRDAGLAESVTVAAIAADGADGRLRRAIAAGADRGVCLDIPLGRPSTLSSALSLVDLASEINASVIVVRNRTSALESCLLASVVGELSEWSTLTGVVGVEARGTGPLRVQRRVDAEIERLMCSVPVVLAIERGHELRYPTYPDRRRSMSAGVTRRDATEPSEAHVAVPTAISSPKPLRKPGPPDSPGEARAMAVVMGITAVTGGRGTVLKGDPAEVAAQLAEACRHALGQMH